MHDYLTLRAPTRREISLCALVAVSILALVLKYRVMGNWLEVIDPEPAHIDVIFTFGGENARDRFSLELARAHPEAVWILSTYNARERIRTLDLYDIDSARLVVVDTLKNTWEEVKFLREWLRQKEGVDSPRTVALVSGPYHMRRIKIAAVRLLNHVPCRLSFVPTPMKAYNHSPAAYRTWWRDRTLRPLVRLECVKTLYYLVRM